MFVSRFPLLCLSARAASDSRIYHFLWVEKITASRNTRNLILVTGHTSAAVVLTNEHNLEGNINSCRLKGGEHDVNALSSDVFTSRLCDKKQTLRRTTWCVFLSRIFVGSRTNTTAAPRWKQCKSNKPVQKQASLDGHMAAALMSTVRFDLQTADIIGPIIRGRIINTGHLLSL